MKVFLPIHKIDQAQRMVFGYATTEALDAHGEVVKRAAIEAALPDYMRFANIREMHQLSAVGVAKEADLDDKGLHLAAKVVDDDAWAKVREGVYKGFSIGGRVTTRDPADRTIITGIELHEISLVDRPANPQALIETYKVWDREAAEKMGARNSRADLALIQAVHDHAVALGASCPGADDAPDDNDAEDIEDAAATDNLAKRAVLVKLARISDRMAALAQTVAEQGRLLRRLADEPAPPKHASARAIEKSRDGAFEAEDAGPETALDAIKKAHRNPIRLGLG